MVYVMGDTHGGLDLQKVVDWDRKVGCELMRDDYFVVAGDFGYPWDFSDEEDHEMSWLESRAYTVLFVDGNHENFGWWHDRPYEGWHGGLTQRLRPHSPVRRLCRGEVFDLGGSSVFVMGGATSPDKDWRVPYETWWPCELPDELNFREARMRLDARGWEVDYVITHTCATRLLPRVLYPDPAWRCPSRDRLTDFFDEVEDKLDYKRWYFGHFHRDRDIDDRHTVLYDRVVALGDGVGDEGEE